MAQNPDDFPRPRDYEDPGYSTMPLNERLCRVACIIAGITMQSEGKTHEEAEKITLEALRTALKVGGKKMDAMIDGKVEPCCDLAGAFVVVFPRNVTPPVDDYQAEAFAAIVQNGLAKARANNYHMHRA